MGAVKAEIKKANVTKQTYTSIYAPIHLYFVSKYFPLDCRCRISLTHAHIHTLLHNTRSQIKRLQPNQICADRAGCLCVQRFVLLKICRVFLKVPLPLFLPKVSMHCSWFTVGFSLASVLHHCITLNLWQVQHFTFAHKNPKREVRKVKYGSHLDALAFSADENWSFISIPDGLSLSIIPLCLSTL